MGLSRLLFVGSLGEYNVTTFARLRALQELVDEVETFDATNWLGDGNRLVRLVASRTYIGRSIAAMNNSLYRVVRCYDPDVIWIDKGPWIYPWTLRSLKARGCYLVHYNTDDVFAPTNRFWLHRLGIRFYDIYLTTNRYNVIEISSRYGIPAIRAGMGYDSTLHRPPATAQDFKREHCPVVFMGHWRPHTEEFIAALQQDGIPVRVWGGRWGKAKRASLRSVEVLPNSKYVCAIASASIALCFLSRYQRNESTGRTFEIPAIGTFMLAERTLEHEFLFGDGRGCALFSTEQELIEKTRYYLSHPDERQAIAETGHRRCMDLGLSWSSHMKREWPLVERLLTQTDAALCAADDDPFWRGFRRGAPPSAQI